MLDLEAATPPSCDHMHCAVHTLQLAVPNGLKKESNPLLAKLQAIAKEACTPKIHEQLKGRVGLVAVIDQETRWTG